MNEENTSNYYSIMPATVRYDNRLKANEKILYSEITALANKYGYCYAQNRYFADLYGVETETISRWLSNLQKYGYIEIEIKRNIKNEVIARYIYIKETPYCLNKQYPYCSENQYPINNKIKDNIINNNIDDDIFILYINNSEKIPKDFCLLLDKLEFNYSNQYLEILDEDKIDMIKNIVKVLYALYNSNFNFLLRKVSRDSLINLYNISKEKYPNNLLNYYKRAIINKYTNGST